MSLAAQPPCAPATERRVTRPPAHHTLRATKDWSDQLLNGGEQACFARFAVFAGGATIEAAQTAMHSHALGAGPR